MIVAGSIGSDAMASIPVSKTNQIVVDVDITPTAPRSKGMHARPFCTPSLTAEHVLCLPHCAISKLVPQPQLLCAPGIPVTLNWLPINSIV
jgi:hypothetical protein